MLPASLRPSPPKRQQVISKEEDASSPSQRTRPFLPPPSLIINVDNNDIDAIESLSQDDGDEAKEGLAINTSVMAAGLLMALIGTVYVYLHNPQGVSTPFSLDHMTPEGYSFKQSLISGAVAGVSRGLSRSKYIGSLFPSYSLPHWLSNPTPFLSCPPSISLYHSIDIPIG